MKKQKSIIFGQVKLLVFFLAVIFLSLGIGLLAVKQKQEVRQRAPVKQKQEVRQRAPVSQTDYTQYVNTVQSKQVFMRYPLGRIGLWSRTEGEIADSVTRNIRLYPAVDQMTGKDIADWRNTIVANPAQTDITYGSSTPAKGSTVALTVTPNVAVYRYHFNNVASFGAVGITLGGTAEIHGGLTWSDTLTVIDNQNI